MAKNFDHSELTMPVRVIRGKLDGPILFVSAAIHGDEVNGVDVVGKLLKHPSLKGINGTLLIIPVVNAFGFNSKSRYLPDHRDLNRSFPGSPRGSLASQIAHTFMKEIVKKSTHGIDLHTGAIHRNNLPQVRASLDDSETLRLAKAFGTRVIVDSSIKDGSLREAARRQRIPILLFEGGEALRIDKQVTKMAVDGVLAVMGSIGMISKKTRRTTGPFVARSTEWVRAPQSGLLKQVSCLGSLVKRGECLAQISDPFGESTKAVIAPTNGFVIGINNLSVVNKGDALFHIAIAKSAIKGKNENLYDFEYHT